LRTCGSLVRSWSVTPARLLVAESLVFDRCRNDRFVEKFVKVGDIGQLIGTLLNERAALNTVHLR
jgi:hypothetical protein